MGQPPPVNIIKLGKLGKDDPYVDMGVDMGTTLVNMISRGQIPPGDFTTVVSVILACVTSAMMQLSPGLIGEDEILDVLARNVKAILPAMKTHLINKGTGETINKGN